MHNQLWMRRLAAWLSRRPAGTARSRRPAVRRPSGAQLRLETLEDRNLLSAGNLDTAFNGTGFNLTKFSLGGPNDQGAASVIQPDGKVVVAGSAEGAPNTATYVKAPNAPINLNGPFTAPVAAGDFNGDGNQDVAIAYYFGSVRVFLGNGNGTFVAQPAFNLTGTTAAPPGAFSMTAGRLRDNGNVDLVVGNIQDQSISILLGNGNGTFAVQTLSLTQGTERHSPAALDIGDLGTWHNSIVSVNFDGTVSVILSNGNGTFAAPSTTLGLPTDNLRGVKIVNDGRAHPDLVISAGAAWQLAVVAGNGNGTFDKNSVVFIPGSPNAGAQEPRALDVGDFNGDKAVDVVTADSGSNNFALYLGNGNGTYKPATTFAAAQGAFGIAVGDLNGDGRLDVVTTGLTGQISISLGNGNGTFQAPATPIQTNTGKLLNVVLPKLDPTTDIPAIVTPAFDLPGKALNVYINTSPVGLSDFALARYNTDGTLDATFGNGGKVNIGFNIGGADEDRAFSVGLQPDPLIPTQLDIVAAGYAQVSDTDFDFAVIRLLPNGKLDPKFGSHSVGKSAFTFSHNFVGPNADLATSTKLSITPAGEIIVGGQAQRTPQGGFDMAVARLTVNGFLDPAFGNGGLVTLPTFGTGVPTTENDGVDGIAVQGDGKIVLSGFAGGADAHHNSIAAARLNAGGSLDNTFNSGGIGGVAPGLFALNLNLNPGGDNDDQGTGVAIQQDGKIVISGFAQKTNHTDIGAAVGSFDMVAIRLLASGVQAGTLDTTFNEFGATPGAVHFNLGLNGAGQNDDEANGVALQLNGTIVLSGFAQSGTGDNYQVAVARLLPNGQLDSTFGVVGLNSNLAGTVNLNFFANPSGNNEDVGLSVVIDNRQTADPLGVGDGFSNIIVSGFATTPTGNAFAIARVVALNNIVITGDWTGQGFATPGIYDPRTSTFYLRNSNTTGGADIVTQAVVIAAGPSGTNPAGLGWIPVVGRWVAGATHDGLGLYNPVGSTFFLWNNITTPFLATAPDFVITFGPTLGGFKPVVARLTAGAASSVGVWDPQSDHNNTNNSTFIFRTGPNPPDFLDVTFGPANNGAIPPIRTIPITGDWIGQGFQTVGVWQPSTSTFTLSNSNTAPAANITFAFGPPNGGGTITNVVGGNKWVAGATHDGVGVVNPLAIQGMAWQLKNTLAAGPADISFTYGSPGLGGSPQLAAVGGADAGTDLTDAQLSGIVAGALDRLEAAGLSQGQLHQLRSMQLVITNLSPGEAGLTYGNTIYIDTTGDGYGWFVDPTPGLDNEFQNGVAVPGSGAAGRLDLLSVVLHEFGHGLGLSDLDSAAFGSDLMSAVLDPGVRRVDLIDAVYTQGLS